MAILLKEAGFLDRSLLYATDINQLVLEKAAARKFALDQIQQSEKNYRNAGGLNNLTDYFTVEGKTILFNEDLRRRMVFSPHNLAADKSFNEFNLILCRNVLIYFNSGLQNRVIRLFADSLPTGGLLALGSKEGIDVTYFKDEFEAVNRRRRIWQKK